MGLLDSVLGAVMNHASTEGTAAANASTTGGLGGLLGTLASNPQWLQIAVGMLGNDSTHGGLGGLITKFQQAGLGDVVNSWIGQGANQPVSGEQITQVLGADTLSQLGAQMGVGQSDAASQLAQLLPGLVDHLTPQGQAPASGLGNAGDLMGMLGGLLQKR